jgi:peptidoglycan/LPS O-acetylase OafA/YrhL
MKKENRLTELDWLRACACIMVVAFHYLSRGPRANWTGGVSFPAIDTVAQFGYLGVHLFFMISGFVIFMSAQNRSATAFLKGRFWRLYPSFWTAIAITTTFVVTFKARAFQVSTRDWFANLTMFPETLHATEVDGAYWSLTIEAIFYIYIAIASAIGLLRKPLLLVSAALLVCSANLIVKSSLADTYLLAMWAPYFCVGIVCYLLRNNTVKKPQAYVLLCTGFALALLRTYQLESENPHLWLIFCLTFCTQLIFTAVVIKHRRVRTTTVSRLAGDLTYPLYLIHQNVGYILIAILSTFFGATAAVTITLATVLTISFCISRFIEKKLTGIIRLAVSG